MKRAQAALEFLMLVGFMMAIFVVFYAVIAGLFIDFHEKENQKIAYDLLSMIDMEIGFANNGFDGYKRVFLLPATLEGDSYELFAVHSLGESIEEISVIFREKEYGIPILPRVYVIPPGDVSGSEVNVSRSNGRIYIASDQLDEITS